MCFAYMPTMHLIDEEMYQKRRFAPAQSTNSRTGAHKKQTTKINIATDTFSTSTTALLSTCDTEDSPLHYAPRTNAPHHRHNLIDSSATVS